jgi:hypothetical protein
MTSTVPRLTQRAKIATKTLSDIVPHQRHANATDTVTMLGLKNEIMTPYLIPSVMTATEIML